MNRPEVAVGSVVMFVGYFRRPGAEKTAMVTAVSHGRDGGTVKEYRLKFLDDPEELWVGRHTVLPLEG
jgi:hypothetical protein